VRQARTAAEEANAIFDRENQDFSVRVVQAYLEVLLASDTLRMMQSQRTFLEAALVSAQRALKAGTGTRTDIDAAQARLDLNAAQTLEARQQVDFSRRQLQAYVNRPFMDLAPLDESRLAQMPVPREDLEEWVRRAESESPDVRRLMAQRTNLSLEFEKARYGHLPTLDLVAQAQRSRSENTLAPQSRFDNRSVGVQLNVPIYSGGYINSVTRQAAAEFERVEEALRGIRLDLGVRVHREYRSVTEGVLRIRALEQALRSADVAVDSARKSQEAGVRTAVDVLNAEQQAMQARRDLAQARYGTLAAIVRLQALVGEADEPLVSKLNGLLAP
jgi:TolC family type I secretion outer membrane protein